MDATKKPARRTADHVRQKEADFIKFMLENGPLAEAPATDDFGDPLGQSEYCEFQADPDTAPEPAAGRGATMRIIPACAVCGRPAIAFRANQTMHLDCAMTAHNRETTRNAPNKSRHRKDHPARQAAKTNDSPIIGFDSEGGYTDDQGRQVLLYMSAKDRNGNGSSLFRDNQPLKIGEIFEFLLSLPRTSYICSFFGGYDFSQILRQLPIERLCRLKRLQLIEYVATGRQYARKEGQPDDTDPEAVEEFHRLHPRGDWTDVTIDGRKYRLQYVPGHHFTIARAEPDPDRPWALRTVDRSTRVVHETRGFFQSSFLKAINGWLKDDMTEDDNAKIVKFKGMRGQFDKITPGIADYCDTECRLLAKMVEKFRTMCLECEKIILEKTGRPIKLWNSKNPEGAGTLAARMHETAGTPQRRRYRWDRNAKEAVLSQRSGVTYLPERDPAFTAMINWAYYGGRFEISRVGLIKALTSEPGLKIYNYDINSAYPAGMLHLPCPICTTWRELRVGEKPPRGSLYLAEIVFDHPKTAIWCGFPVRTKDGFLRWPRKGRGAYWSVEIAASINHLGAKVQFIRTWVAETHCDHKPYEWVETIYNFRAELKAISETLGIPLKLAINSLYGKFAQSIGAAPYRDYLSAGLITAYTRAKLIEAIGTLPPWEHDNVLMLATDGIYATAPLPKLKISSSLGDWGHKPSEQVYDDMFIVQPGLYLFPSKLDAIREKEAQEKANDPEGTRHALIAGEAREQAEIHLKSRGFHRSLVYTYQKDFEGEWQEYLFHRFIAPTVAENAAPSVTIEYPTFIGLELGMAREQTRVRDAMISGFAADEGVRELDDGAMALPGDDDGDGPPNDEDDGDDGELSDEDHAALDALLSGMPAEALVIERSALDVAEKASPDAGAPNNVPEGTHNSASEYLTEVGKWINDKKEISFDWTNKRACKTKLLDQSLQLFPHEGSVDEPSVPYNRGLLSVIRTQTLETADLPDFFQILDDGDHDQRIAE